MYDFANDARNQRRQELSVKEARIALFIGQQPVLRFARVHPNGSLSNDRDRLPRLHPHLRTPLAGTRGRRPNLTPLAAE